MTMTLQLPLMVSIGGIGTDNPLYTPGKFSLPADAVTVTPDTTREEDTLLSGYGIRLTPAALVKAYTIRIDIPADHPIPRTLGEPWAALAVGSVTTVTETHTQRSTQSSYTNAEILTNTLKVTRQSSLLQAYYSGAIELRVMVEAP